jgi:hypothetical protein
MTSVVSMEFLLRSVTVTRPEVSASVRRLVWALLRPSVGTGTKHSRQETTCSARAQSSFPRPECKSNFSGTHSQRESVPGNFVMKQGIFAMQGEGTATVMSFHRNQKAMRRARRT